MLQTIGATLAGAATLFAVIVLSESDGVASLAKRLLRAVSAVAVLLLLCGLLLRACARYVCFVCR